VTHAKKLPEDLTARIEAEIARHPNGIGIDDLHAILTDIVSRRTLQRRLGELSDQKRSPQQARGADCAIANPDSSKPISPSKFTRRMR